MGMFGNKTMQRVLIALLAVIFIGAVAQAVYIDAFNKTLHTAAGGDDTQQTNLQFNDRADSTSRWVKRDYDLYGQTVDIWAQTVDGTLSNNSDDAIASWKLTIDIEDDCFINNAWTGVVEIHQFAGTDQEAVQTLDLRAYDIADVELSHLYDGDLLIPLQKGDRLVYHPSDEEIEVAPHGELTMGMIFYFLDELSLSDYSIDYYYHRDFTHGIGFIALAALAVLWVFLLVGAIASNLSYRRAMRDMELRKSGLASMSSIYSIISFIDLENDELVNVYMDEKTKGTPPEGAGARQKLIDIFNRDTAEPYREVVLEFVDIGTLPQRLEKESIACEYVSKAYGWSSVRFFAVDREEGQPLKRVLLTIQDINDEKRQMSRFEERAVHAERENQARNAFVLGVSSSMRYPIQDVLELDDAILDRSTDKSVLDLARKIQSRTRLLSYMAESTADSSRLVTGSVALSSEEYSFDTMVGDVSGIAEDMMEDKSLAFETDIPHTFPDLLVGDMLGIERALVGLFAYAAREADGGKVRFAIYGKEVEDHVHLLFSVRMSETGLTEADAANLAAFVAGLDEEDDYVVGGNVQELEMSAVQLALAGTKLHVVNTPGEECEFYFEIEQRTAAPSSKAGEDGRTE